MTNDVPVGTAGRWRVRRLSDSAARVHAAESPAPAVPEAWLVDVEAPALVLGSAQRRHADALVAWSGNRPEPLDIVVRRSGGGAVYLAPGEQVWIEVFVPAGDQRWDADVGRAFAWLGDLWAEAIRSTVSDAEVSVHVSGPAWSAWSDLVCFAGMGSGEVALGGRKVVGLSQRRTRGVARFQCMALLRWRPEVYAEAFAVLAETVDGVPTVADLASSAASIPASGDALTLAFLDALAQR